MVKEFLYVDDTRLNSYVTQIAGSTLETEKERKLAIELGWTGPKATLEQEAQKRELAIHKKIARLEQQLEQSGQLATSRPTKRFLQIEFVREHFDAFRVTVPEGAHSAPASPSFAFWLSPGDEYRGMLCLLEDCRSDDGKPYDYSRASTYTVLQSLVHFARSKIRHSILAGVIPNSPQPNPYAKVDETHPPSLLHDYHNVKLFLEDFVKNPVPMLTDWGCLVGTPRRVCSLYRVREYGPEAAQGYDQITTFAYPIYIHESLRPAAIVK